MKGNQFEKYDDIRKLEIFLLIQMDSYDKFEYPSYLSSYLLGPIILL
jgi:hypothetical protein